MIHFNKINIGLLILFLLFCSFSPLFSQSKGGRWQFENNGFDTADWDGHDDNGTLQGQADYSSLQPLQEGVAYLWLDPSVQYDFFKINDNNDLDFGDENIGISAWIYPVVVGDDDHWILHKGDRFINPKTTNYSFRIAASSKLEFLIRDSQNIARKVASSFIIPEDQWTFVGIFYDYSAGKVYMWNSPASSPVDTLDFTQAYFSNTDPLAIGSRYNSDPSEPSSKDFEGRIDDVRISGRLEDILPAITSVRSDLQISKSKMNPKIHIHPNPVNISNGVGNVTMQFELNNRVDSQISVYNILGQQVFNSSIPGAINRNSWVWNLRDQYGLLVNTGIYFVRLETMGSSDIKKLIVIK